MLIHLMEPVKELRENLRAEDDSQGGSNGRRNRVSSAHPVPKPKRVLRVDPKVGNAVQCRRHGDKVLGNRFLRLRGVGTINYALFSQTIEEPLADNTRIRDGFQRCEGLGGYNNQRCLRIKVANRIRSVGRVNIRDETCFHPLFCERPQRLINHHGAEVGTPDANVDDRCQRFACDSRPGPVPDLVCKRVDLLEFGMYCRHHIGSIDQQGLPLRSA